MSESIATQDEDPDDVGIKKLLLSKDPNDRNLGFIELDDVYCATICGSLRARFPSCGATIAGSDVYDIWQEVLLELWTKVSNDKFRAEGSIRKCLWTMAVYRLIDKLRKQALATLADFPDVPVLDKEDLEELLEAIRQCASRLTEGRRRVLLIDVEIFVERFKMPSSDELTAQDNKERMQAMGADYTEQSNGAVRSSRSRARNTIGACLQNRGFQW